MRDLEEGGTAEGGRFSPGLSHRGEPEYLQCGREDIGWLGEASSDDWNRDPTLCLFPKPRFTPR